MIIIAYLVYVHTCPNGKRYVGKTKLSASDRWGTNGYNYRTQLFYRAIQKYGWDNIQHDIVADGLTKEEADSLEMKYISEYNTMNNMYGYNCTSGGDSGFEITEETRIKLSDSHKGQIMSEKNREALLKAHKGIQRKEETKQKISVGRKEYLKNHPEALLGENNPFYGKRHTEETKRKNGDAHRGKPYAARKIKIIDQETKEELYFNSQSEAAKFLNVSQALISYYVSGKKKHKKYLFERI